MTSRGTIEGILFEIARTLDFCRTDFPAAARYMIGATAHLQAQRSWRGFLPTIEWKGGAKEVHGGDWCEIPALLRDLSTLIDKVKGPVKSFVGQFGPDDVLTLQATGADGPICEWSFAFSSGRKPFDGWSGSDVLLANADHVSGIPAGIVGGLRALNEQLRGKLCPLKPKAEIPVKFWNAADPAAVCAALQYLRGHLLGPYDFDAARLPILPEGYATACAIFEAFEQIENEGLDTAIGNLGLECGEKSIVEFDHVGLPELADPFRKAWTTHPESSSADAQIFAHVEDELDDAIDDEATIDTICRYFRGRADLFEQTPLSTR